MSVRIARAPLRGARVLALRVWTLGVVTASVAMLGTKVRHLLMVRAIMVLARIAVTSATWGTLLSVFV